MVAWDDHQDTVDREVKLVARAEGYRIVRTVDRPDGQVEVVDHESGELIAVHPAPTESGYFTGGQWDEGWYHYESVEDVSFEHGSRSLADPEPPWPILSADTDASSQFLRDLLAHVRR